jgi:hypothetical protein
MHDAPKFKDLFLASRNWSPSSPTAPSESRRGLGLKFTTDGLERGKQLAAKRARDDTKGSVDDSLLFDAI